MGMTFVEERRTPSEVIKKQAFRILLSIFIVLNSALPSAAQKTARQNPLIIEKQGSFAVGGTVITNPGTFDPYNPAPAGQTFQRRSCLCLLSDSCKGTQISVGNVAWYRPVFQNLGNNT